MTTKDIIEQIARNNQTTPQEVEEEIRIAIRTAMAADDPKAQALWKQLAPEGKEPSIEQFIQFCAERIKENKNS